MKEKIAEAMEPILEAYAHYAGKKENFCQEYGISVHKLDYWRRKVKKGSSGSSSFIALDLKSSPSTERIELYYPNGIRAVVPVSTPLAVLQKLLKISE